MDDTVHSRPRPLSANRHCAHREFVILFAMAGDSIAEEQSESEHITLKPTLDR